MDDINKKPEPTDDEICMMCHLSSGCSGCCKHCKQQCNSHQVCQIGVTGQADRLASWLKIISNQEVETDIQLELSWW